MKRVVFLLFLVAGIVGLVGCAEVRDDDVTRPWAEPEPWERNIDFGGFGGPLGRP